MFDKYFISKANKRNNYDIWRVEKNIERYRRRVDSNKPRIKEKDEKTILLKMEQPFQTSIMNQLKYD